MRPNKAPRLDGYQAGFYQRIWDGMKILVWNFASRFFIEGVSPPKINKTLIILVPKASQVMS